MAGTYFAKFPRYLRSTEMYNMCYLFSLNEHRDLILPLITSLTVSHVSTGASLLLKAKSSSGDGDLAS